MVNIDFLGDIMLGRFVAEKYSEHPYQLLDQNLLNKLQAADVRVANLESPVFNGDSEDSLRFAAKPKLLDQFKWVNCFSLSNNHINDFGTQGMIETIAALDAKEIGHNGLYGDGYKPFMIDKGVERIAVITCADMMNYEFSEDCPYKTLRVNQSEEIQKYILDYKAMGFFVILYAHVGMLFTRFPNPVIRDFVHNMVDIGADCIVTAHPHCLGGYELYKDKLIVYSLGDFLMDGASIRRREAGVLSLEVEGNKIKKWSIEPVFTDDELTVHLAQGKRKERLLNGFRDVSDKIKKNETNYASFYKRQYKKELLAHSMSTVSFEYHKRGLFGLLRTLYKRIGAVGSMAKRVFTDRSKMSYDADAVSDNNTSINDLR